MSALRRTIDDSIATEAADFSLVLGGPLFQLWRRSRLVGNALELLHRRIIARESTIVGGDNVASLRFGN